MKLLIPPAIVLAIGGVATAQYIGSMNGIVNPGHSAGSAPVCTSCILAENGDFILSESGSNLVVE
jgi:hypothetical protein